MEDNFWYSFLSVVLQDIKFMVCVKLRILR